MSSRLLMSPVLNEANARFDGKARVNGDKFSHLFVDCVEDALTDLLGARVREGLLDYLAREARLARTDVLEQPNELSTLLKKCLGRGAVETEKCIMRRLYAVLGWNFKESANFNFANQVEEARVHWRTTSFTHPLAQ